MKKKSLKTLFFLSVFTLSTMAGQTVNVNSAYADEEEPADETQSYYDNPAQMAHAQNLATQYELQNPQTEPAEATAEQEGAESVSEVSGVSVESIMGMREEGMGWGEIAHELGIHPGFLGLGHTKRTQSELAEATARDPKSGWSQGHGAGIKSQSKSGKNAGAVSNPGKGANKGSDAGGKGNKGGGGNKGGNGKNN